MSLERREFVRLLLSSPLLGCGRAVPSPEPTASAPEPAPAGPEGPGGGATREPGAYTAHIAELRERLGPGPYTILVEEPFVVVGDAHAEQVEAYAREIVRWSVQRLKQAYFEKDPGHIIDIFLFEGSESYERHALKLFGEEPDTPYGYYSGKDRAVVMNIATGGGTLVHEIVHPFVGANFPDCPAWFNEGLASLYEQCADRDGAIVGLTNWRLAGLQEAIERGDVPPFRDLCASGDGFYSKDPGTNYAQARYLCYWLQEHGELGQYYRAFAAAAPVDATGYQTLTSVLERDPEQFKDDWERYVMGLRYPV